MGEELNNERRRRERIAADISLTCRVPAQPIKARLLDLSHNGCRVELARGRTEPGASIVLEMPNGDTVQGQVMWSTAKEAGVRFAKSLRPQTAIMLGLDDGQTIVVAAQPEPASDSESKGVLHHWYRNLIKVFG